MGALLSVREIAPQYADTGGGEFFSQRHQQGRVGISACAVGQHKEIAGGTRGAVQCAPHRSLPGRFIH